MESLTENSWYDCLMPVSTLIGVISNVLNGVSPFNLKVWFEFTSGTIEVRKKYEDPIPFNLYDVYTYLTSHSFGLLQTVLIERNRVCGRRRP